MLGGTVKYTIPKVDKRYLENLLGNNYVFSQQYVMKYPCPSIRDICNLPDYYAKAPTTII